MASDRSKLLWERSKPLSEYAATKFMENHLAEPLVATGLRWQIPELILRLLKLPLSANSPIIRAIIVDAKRGKLIVTGRRREPTQSPAPVLIPRAALAYGRISLLRNRIEGNGFAYDELRLIPRNALPRQMRWQRPNQQLRTAQIGAVIKSLQKSGALSGKLRKQQIGIVRDELEKAGVKNIGAAKTLEKLIRQIIGPVKAN